MKEDLSYMSHMTDEQILESELKLIAQAIEAVRAVAHIHGMHEDGLFDPDWMDGLDVMIQRLRQRDADCLRGLRSVNKLAVPAVSH